MVKVGISSDLTFSLPQCHTWYWDMTKKQKRWHKLALLKPEKLIKPQCFSAHTHTHTFLVLFWAVVQLLEHQLLLQSSIMSILKINNVGFLHCKGRCSSIGKFSLHFCSQFLADEILLAKSPFVSGTSAGPYSHCSIIAAKDISSLRFPYWQSVGLSWLRRDASECWLVLKTPRIPRCKFKICH